eukprot:scaffold230506_cov44-Prasinocladus_malaysianus.AAC.2
MTATVGVTAVPLLPRNNSAATGPAKAIVWTTRLTRVGRSPDWRATSTTAPDAAEPTAMTAQGRKDRSEDALRKSDVGK